ncbi:hypothetical protein BDW74DRAFT_148189 [Aspergillus multicolor]|uniref:uncharacterized protein n=1 Tax=Aspergillus multicolor TaxID=41759 RepID=UPI003CCCE84D
MQASPAPKPVAANGAWRGFSLPIARNTSNATLVPAPTPAPVLASTPPASLLSWRKSRFDILSGEVGAALSVVYRECEEVPLLRRTAEELETKMSSLQQEVNIYKNEMQLLKKSSSGTQITKVTSRKNHLERENVELRKQLENSEQALKQWKGKLAGILGQNI